MLQSVEKDPLVDLVGIDAHIGVATSADDVADPAQLGGVQDSPRWIGRGAQDDQLGALGNTRGQVVRGEGEPRVFVQMEWARYGADERGPGLVDRKPRGSDRPPRRQGRRRSGRYRPMGGLGTGRDHDPVGSHVDAASAADVIRDGFTEGRDPGRVAISGASGAQRLDRHLVQVRGASEVRGPQVEANHVHPSVDTPLDVVPQLEGVLRS